METEQLGYELEPMRDAGTVGRDLSYDGLVPALDLEILEKVAHFSWVEAHTLMSVWPCLRGYVHLAPENLITHNNNLYCFMYAEPKTLV